MTDAAQAPRNSLLTINDGLTEEERAFLETAREDFEKQAFVFSFDENLFCKRIGRRRIWEQVIQGHLYFDHVVTQMLVEGLVNPDAIQARRLAFSQKLDLLEALGLVEKPYLAPLRVINDLRNKFAHQLEFKVSRKAVRDL